MDAQPGGADMSAINQLIEMKRRSNDQKNFNHQDVSEQMGTGGANTRR